MVNWGSWGTGQAVAPRAADQKLAAGAVGFRGVDQQGIDAGLVHVEDGIAVSP